MSGKGGNDEIADGDAPHVLQFCGHHQSLPTNFLCFCACQDIMGSIELNRIIITMLMSAAHFGNLRT